ncbi:hypothetical protein G9A89_023421 [Geosiphon pyriformis]|nr:hypothetical protein G9A89_023421 [Geosiphon pyriformis]
MTTFRIPQFANENFASYIKSVISRGIMTIMLLHSHNEEKQNSTIIIRSRKGLDGVKTEYPNQFIVRDHLPEYAWWAMRSYCLDGNNLVGPGVYAKVVVRNSKLILMVKGESLDNENYWEKRENQLIDYPILSSKAIGAKVDKIFYKNFKKIRKAVTNLILTALRKHEVEIIIAVGHGSGGVYAILQMLELVKLSMTVPLRVCTFGQPHLANREFFQQFNRMATNINEILLTRVTNMNDYVPKLPESTIRDFYVQSPSEIWIESDDCQCATGKVYICLGPKFFQNDGSVILQENQDCNAQFSEKNFAPHNGPYFDYMMGKCLDVPPPWDINFWQKLRSKYFRNWKLME